MPTLNANNLRRFAEAVDSIRDKNVSCAVQDEQLVVVANQTDPGTFLVVRTNLRGEGGLNGRAVLSVSTANLPREADAVFTTQAAFEKFVLPYYCRTRSMDELNDMATRFYKRNVTCAYHDPSSETRPGGGDLFLLHENNDITPI